MKDIEIQDMQNGMSKQKPCILYKGHNYLIGIIYLIAAHISQSIFEPKNHVWNVLSYIFLSFFNLNIHWLFIVTLIL